MNDCPRDLELQAYYDGQLPMEQAGAIARHLTACAECARTLSAMAEMSSLFASVQRPTLLPIARMRLHRAVDTAINNAIGAMDGGLQRIAWGLSSVAACILIAGSAWMMQFGSAPPEPRARAVVESPPWVSVATNADADLLVHEQASPVAQWYLADAGRRSDELP